MTTVKLVKFAPLTLRKELEGQDTCILTWSIRAGYPRITVYTKEFNPDQKTDYNSIIIAPFDYVTLHMLLDTFEKIIDAENGKKLQVDCYNIKWKNGEKTNEKYIQARVIFGKDDNGVIYLAAIEEGKKKVKFDLLPKLEWFKIRDSEGGELKNKAMLSKMFARTYLDLVKKLMTNEMISDGRSVVEFEPKSGGQAPSKPTYSKQEESKKEEVKDEPKIEDASLQDLENLI